MTNTCVITLYAGLLAKLEKRGWVFISPWRARPQVHVYIKQHGNYFYIAHVNYIQHRATFSRYERLSG